MTPLFQSSSGLPVSQKVKMAAVRRVSQALLRSALSQSRRQFSAAAAGGHGEQAGKCGTLLKPTSEFNVRRVSTNASFSTVTLLTER